MAPLLIECQLNNVTFFEHNEGGFTRGHSTQMRFGCFHMKIFEVIFIWPFQSVQKYYFLADIFSPIFIPDLHFFAQMRRTLSILVHYGLPMNAVQKAKSTHLVTK